MPSLRVHIKPEDENGGCDREVPAGNRTRVQDGKADGRELNVRRVHREVPDTETNKYL